VLRVPRPRGPASPRSGRACP